MNVLSLIVILAYLSINLLIGGFVNLYFNPGLTGVAAVFSVTSAIIGASLVLVELALPRKIKIVQVGLSILTIVLHVGPNTRTAAMVVFGVVILIKIYAFCLVMNYVRGRLNGKVPAINSVSGKDFYNSQSWRALRYATLNKQGRRCVSCGEARVKDWKGKLISYHVDHIKPRSKFPHLALDPNNMQVMCAACNLGKSNKWDIDHREERGIA